MGEVAVEEKVLKLCRGELIVYIFTRLYDYIEKLQAAYLEKYILRGLKRALADYGLELSAYPIFMPFRDTRENEVVGPNKTRIIYQQDLQRLNRLFACVGLLDDPSKDDGICMEIGYAFARRVPIIIVVSDFIWYAPRAVGGVEYVLDPVLLRIASKIINRYEIPPDNTIAANERASFSRRLLKALRQIGKDIEEEAYTLIIDYRGYPVAPLPHVEVLPGSVYLDFGGGKHEWERLFLAESAKYLEENMGLKALTSKRHWPEAQRMLVNKGMTGTSLALTLGEIDILSALKAEFVVICGDGPEVDAGAAAILGIAKAVGKTIILYYSGNMEIRGEGEHLMIRNLMLEFAADALVTKLEDIYEVLADLRERVMIRQNH